jgi:hypothetical protein
LIWVWLSRAWSGWPDVLVFVKPSTVISSQRKRFRDHWTRLSRRGKPGRLPIAQEIRGLIRKMSRANPSWGSPRIQSELRELGIDVAKSTVEKYRVRPRKPTSPTWRAFLWDSAPRFLLRDRDDVYGTDFRRRVHSMSIEEVIIAARSPWQSPYVERMIGSIRRECLDPVVVLSERHLQRILKDYFSHYHRWRCHHSLEMDCPEPRAVQPRQVGEVVEVREAGGLYRHYRRSAA